MRLAVARKSAGLSQGELGKRIGVSYHQIQKYETGTNRVSATSLLNLARALDISLGYFFEGIAVLDGSKSPALDETLTLQAATPEGKKLLQAFFRIKQQKIRNRLLDFVVSLSQEPESLAENIAEPGQK
jgi:transcriptional regulator with XRE-family HTH domain